MIADLKPYPDYKESGLPWLGQVPGHWQPTKLKHASKRIIGGSTPASGNPKYWNGDMTWVTPADVAVLNAFVDQFDRSLASARSRVPH